MGSVVVVVLCLLTILGVTLHKFFRRKRNAGLDHITEVESLESIINRCYEENSSLRARIQALQQGQEREQLSRSLEQIGVHHKALVRAVRVLHGQAIFHSPTSLVQFHGNNAVRIGRQYFTMELDAQGNVLNLWPAPTSERPDWVC